MKNYKKVFATFFINFLLVSAASAAVANIDRVVFTSDIQTVPIGEISGEINIQTQNAESAPEALDETGDLTLTSTSATGEFSSSNTTWKADSALTMNKTWSNRKFYYKDSASGSFTITATLTTRTTGQNWTATQTINIGNTDSGVASSSVAATTTATSTVSTTVTGGVSTHYIQEDLSPYNEPSNIFEVSAGRDRLAYVGSSLSLEAKHKLSKDLNNKNCDYFWTFGDGASLAGEKVEHLYKNAGEYNVVLNGVCGELKSVSRMLVKILAPKLVLQQIQDGSVIITNNSKFEMNLYGFKLVSGTQNFVFPMDTIVSAGREVIFPAEYIKIPASGNVILFDVAGQAVANIDELARFLENYKRLTSS